MGSKKTRRYVTSFSSFSYCKIIEIVFKLKNEVRPYPPKTESRTRHAEGPAHNPTFCCWNLNSFIAIGISAEVWIRELFKHGKAMVPYVQLSTYFRIGFWYNEKNYIVIKLSSPKLVDNCTYGTIAFPCIKSSLFEYFGCRSRSISGLRRMYRILPCPLGEQRKLFGAKIKKMWEG